MARKRDNKQKQQQVLLDELASIKDLLDDDSDNARDIDLLEGDLNNAPVLDEPYSEDAIPVLQEVVNGQQQPIERANITEAPRQPGVSPNQQSLFTESTANKANVHHSTQSEPKSTYTSTSKIKTPKSAHSSSMHENPFLPKHIRQRLSIEAEMSTGNRQQAITRASDVTRTQNKRVSSQHKHDSDKIIDSLVKEFLPKIEARLREQLRETLTTPRNKKP